MIDGRNGVGGEEIPQPPGRWRPGKPGCRVSPTRRGEFSSLQAHVTLPRHPSHPSSGQDLIRQDAQAFVAIGSERHPLNKGQVSRETDILVRREENQTEEFRKRGTHSALQYPPWSLIHWRTEFRFVCFFERFLISRAGYCCKTSDMRHPAPLVDGSACLRKLVRDLTSCEPPSLGPVSDSG